MQAQLLAPVAALTLIFAALTSAACVDGGPAAEDGGVDAGGLLPQQDAGPSDAGDGGDAGAPDAGGDFDAGEDAGIPMESCDGEDNDGDGFIDEGPDGELLACGGCSGDLVDPATSFEQFDDATSYMNNWSAQYAAPTLTNGELVFGPHGDSPNWWDKYSWVSTHATYGDVLACARFRFNAAGTRPGTFELFVRSSGDLLTRVGLSPRTNEVNLSTRTSASMNTWVTLDTETFTFAPGMDAVFEILLVARGDRFRAELRNLVTGDVAQLAAQSTEAAANGSIGFIGWTLDRPVAVDAVLIGPPSARATAFVEAQP